ncbi:MAG: class I SAM-dependent methyltransferase [Bdellovibrionales bacterium]|nr:class I SAM-dependent methyltransferase [Bdellovibrionales bacterium]
MLEKFNHIYENESAPRYELSLKSFFESEVQKRLKKPAEVLDLGSGSKSLFQDIDLDNMRVEAVDFSPAAILRANDIDNLQYHLLDITEKNSLGNNRFDLIFDSHCLHCLTKPDDRNAAFKNIYEALKNGALFSAEMMVRTPGTQALTPSKYVPNARDLEEEILRHGFKIIYFMIVRDLNFIGENGDCDLLRVILRK